MVVILFYNNITFKLHLIYTIRVNMKYVVVAVLINRRKKIDNFFLYNTYTHKRGVMFSQNRYLRVSIQNYKLNFSSVICDNVYTRNREKYRAHIKVYRSILRYSQTFGRFLKYLHDYLSTPLYIYYFHKVSVRRRVS